jgi:hypothetical protein
MLTASQKQFNTNHKFIKVSDNFLSNEMMMMEVVIAIAITRAE